MNPMIPMKNLTANYTVN